MADRPPLNEDSAAVQAHLAMMQGVINRMAENSRACKVWCVTLVAAVLVLVARTGEPQHALLALLPAVLFPFLDTYYVALEQAFIRSHNRFVDRLHGEELERGDIYRISREGMGLRLFARKLGSVSIWLFYLPIAVTIFLAWKVVLPSGTLSDVLP